MEDSYTFEDVRQYEFLEEDYTCTCYHCNESEYCAYAYDPYNMDGECLASK